MTMAHSMGKNISCTSSVALTLEIYHIRLVLGAILCVASLSEE